MTELREYISNLSGYKIEDTHFRIGSKLHIDPFFYAMRFFQNSFYASKIAIIISKDIIDCLESREDIDIKEGITLIGYGLYSELLVSLVEKYLQDVIANKINTDVKSNKSKKKENNKEQQKRYVNHDLISNYEETVLIKNYEKINKNIFLIIPIASTFTTSIKMEQAIRKMFKDKKMKFIEPYINVVNVINGKEDVEVFSEDSIEYTFGWRERNIDEKTVIMKAFINEQKKDNQDFDQIVDDDRKQKYYFALESNWYIVEDCQKCFPDDPTEEIPLLHTDKTSVSPMTLIFDLPRARKIEKVFEKVPHFGNNLLYGHYNRDDKCYLYYIKTDSYFNQNRDKIKIWLANVKRELKNNLIPEIEYSSPSDYEIQNAILVVPGHYSNMGFVNLVNQVVFSNSAHIIHYNSESDHYKNFRLFMNEDTIKKSKIYFVDDAITTGSKFISCFTMLKHINKEINSFDGCFVVVDRSSSYVFDNVSSKIKRENYFSYVNIYLPSFKNLASDCPLCTEETRYNRLVKLSYLDRQKVIFFKKVKKLEKREVTSDKFQKDYLEARIGFIHKIYDWFTKNYENSNREEFLTMSLEKWIREIDKINSPFIEDKSKNGDIDKKNKTMLKVLSQIPFVSYKPIKKMVFKWVLGELNGKIENLEYDKVITKDINDIKFYSRRAGLLYSNFLLSEKYLEMLRKINKCLNKESGKNSNRDLIQAAIYERNRAILELNEYFPAQIKELILQNNAICVKLEERLIKQETKDFTNSFKQLIRIVREENGILIENFWEYFYMRGLNEVESIDGIKEFIKKPSVTNNYRYDRLIKFLDVQTQKKESIQQKDKIMYFFLLMNTIHNDLNDQEYYSNSPNEQNKRKKLSLHEKTNRIMNYLEKIVFDHIDEYYEKGSFLVVKYKTANRDPYFFAYNKAMGICLNQDKINENNMIIKFLNEEDEFNELMINGFKCKKSIVEYQLDEPNNNQNNDHDQNLQVWNDIYYDEEIKINLKPVLPTNYNRLLLVRISKLIHNGECKDKGQAIIGFYYNSNGNSKPIDIPTNRLLLLLRSPISKFIEKHHESDEFRDWVESESKRNFALLTGHGKHMLRALALSDKEMFLPIVNTLEHIKLIESYDFENEYRMDSKQVFNNFYNVIGKEKLNDLRLKLKELAIKIFESEEVENKLEENSDFKILVSDEEDKSSEFPINIVIIKTICLEVFINAKRNRYLKVKDILEANNDKILNEVIIGVSIINNDTIGENRLPGEKLLNIVIKNSSPQLTDDLIKKIYYYSGNNRNGYIAGTKLISTLTNNFMLGTAKFDKEAVKGKEFPNYFITDLKFASMEGNDV